MGRFVSGGYCGGDIERGRGEAEWFCHKEWRRREGKSLSFFGAYYSVMESEMGSARKLELVERRGASSEGVDAEVKRSVLGVRS